MSCIISFLLAAFVVIQTVTSQVIGNPGIGYGQPGNFGLDLPFGSGPGCQGLPVSALAASRGGAFSVSSFSPITPTGMSVYSENTIEGDIGVKGQLPFLGAIGFEGDVPANGQSVIEYGCGNGDIKIEREEVPAQNPNAFPGVGLGGPFGPGFGW